MVPAKESVALVECAPGSQLAPPFTETFDTGAAETWACARASLTKARSKAGGHSTPPGPREPRRSPLQDPSRGPGQSWPTTRAATARVCPQSATLLIAPSETTRNIMNHTKTKLRLASKRRGLGIRHLRSSTFIKGINGGIQNLQLGRRRQPEPGLDLDKPAREQRLRSNGFNVVVDEDLRIEVQAPFNPGSRGVCAVLLSGYGRVGRVRV